MEISMKRVAFKASKYDVTVELAKALHSPNFADPMDKRPMNFQVHLYLSEAGGVQNNGTGILTLPTEKIGHKFMNLVRTKELKVKVLDRPIFFERSMRPPRPATVQTLQKVPYQDPAIDQEREEKILRLDISLRIDKVQFGVWSCRPTPAVRGIFCPEWDRSYTSIGNALLWFEYDHKLLRVQLGDPAQDDIANSIVIKFSTIRQLWTGYEIGNPFLCFDLLSPPIFECEWFNRTRTGVVKEDERKFRQRIGSIDDGHAVVAPYAHQLRLVLYRDQDLDEFSDLCHIAGLRRPLTAEIDTEKHAFFSNKPLNKLEKWYETMDWPVAFQLEALVHNGQLTTAQLLTDLWRAINDLRNDHPADAAEILRHFSQVLKSKPPSESILKCFQRSCKAKLGNIQIPHSSSGMFRCHHITFTPTRMTLEGPYPTQSNRVIRSYPVHKDHFIRVDFRDEDRVQYRWDREVDGTTFLQERVGGILKNGFTLGGRNFQFLAYSSSALREHAVWFINPFAHNTICSHPRTAETGSDDANGHNGHTDKLGPCGHDVKWVVGACSHLKEGEPETCGKWRGTMANRICGHSKEILVDAWSIRKSLGDFRELLSYPAKYAARLAQAFTATDGSVTIHQGQWITIPDLGKEPYEFTDGVGTISRALSDMIWEKLCLDRRDRGLRVVKPSAYQIRFLGCKGMVSVDDHLQGIKMCIRPSMKKFDTHETLDAEIEIARAFEQPGTMYLNRQLIMILEDRGVNKDVFIRLQEKAVADAYTAQDTFGMSIMMQRLNALGLNLKHRDSSKSLNNPFLDRVIHYAVNTVLRDIKHRARIPVENSWTLVGVADEGPAYEANGSGGVITLSDGEIFACIQNDPGSEPRYLKGHCVISRSPTVHPGDVQRVWAIGEPPKTGLCLFRNLVNVVVFASKPGEKKAGPPRSLPSCLGGGDLDGDLFNVSQDSSLLPSVHAKPASYPPVNKREISLDELRDENGEVKEELITPHICDFIVEYINSDVLGLLSDNHLIRADQASDGVFDQGCLYLAKLCSQAVDYPKNGMPVDIQDSPHRLIPYKPDWKKGEEDSPRRTDFYESTRALGHLFRGIDIEKSVPRNGTSPPPGLLSDPISRVLGPMVNHTLAAPPTDKHSEAIENMFTRYINELRYICVTHTLSDAPGERLSEEEVVLGTILAQSSNQRWRTERTYRMRNHTSTLVQDIKRQMLPHVKNMPEEQLREALELCWQAWRFCAQRLTAPGPEGIFGVNSFRFIALNNILDILETQKPTSFVKIE